MSPVDDEACRLADLGALIVATWASSRLSAHIAYETFTILTSTTAQLKSVRRALFGSTAKAHQAGTKTWAVS